MCLKPSNVPRVCRPWSVQLATTKAGAVILEKSAAFERQKSSNSGCSRVSVSRSSILPLLAPQRFQSEGQKWVSGIPPWVATSR